MIDDATVQNPMTGNAMTGAAQAVDDRARGVGSSASMRRYYSLIVGELVPFIGFYGAIFAISLVTADFAENIVLPGGEMARDFTFRAFVGGFILGVLILGWDESRGSLDYVRHRGFPYLRQQWVHHAASATVLLGVHFAGIAAWLGYHGFSDAAAIVDGSRVLTLCVTGAASASGYALGFWIAALPWNAGARAVFGILAFLAFLTVLRDQVERSASGGTGSAATFLLINLVLAVTLLMAGHHALRFHRDCDRPLPTRGALLQGLLVALVLAACAGGVAREIQQGRLTTLAARYPSVASVPDGDTRATMMLANHIDGADGMVPVDEERRPLDPELDRTGLQYDFMPWRHWIRTRQSEFEALALDSRRYLDEGFPFEGPYEAMADGHGWSGWLDRGAARMEFIHLGSGGQTPARTFLAPEGGLSATARVIRPAEGDLPGIVLDQGVAYAVILSSPPTMERLDLASRRVTEFSSERDEVLLATDDGVWRVADEATATLLTGAEARAANARIERDGRARAQSELRAHSIGDPIEFEITARIGERDQVISYRPTTRTEKVASWVMRSAALLRPPTLIAISHARTLPSAPLPRLTFERAWFFDPLVAGGKRLAWVLASAVLATILAVIQWYALRRRGVTAPRARGWTVLTLLLGPSGFLVGLLIESRSAWRWASAEFPAAAPPRIVSQAG